MNISKQPPTVIDTPGSVNSFTDNSQELINRLVTDSLDIWTTAIKKRSATGRGSNKKIELTGSKKLRELILELAVRGKLVPQDPNDEPASVLLEKITAEKAQLIKDKKIKKPKVLPEIGADEKLFILPEHWCWARFGNIAQHNSGKTLDKGRNSGNPYPYLTTSNLYWGKFDLKNVREMLIENEQLEKCTAKKNDLLICEGGEAGRAAVWEKDIDICFQNHIHRARFYSGISPFFMFRFFEQLTASGEINNHRKGVGISNMSGKSLALIITPLPPLAEQHRIVSKVDELMRLCDQLEQQTEGSITAHQTLVETLLATLSNSETPAAFDQNWIRIAGHFDTLFTTDHSIDQLEQTILQLAVMGKLVPQNPNDLPATELLEQLEKEQKDWLDKNVENNAECKTMLRKLKKLTIPNAPFTLPNTWSCVHLIQLSQLLVDCHNKTAPYVDSGIPIIRTTNIREREFRSNDLKFITQETYEYWSRRCPPVAGDIMFTREAPMGEAMIIPEGVKWCLGQRTMLIRPMHKYVLNEFLLLTLTEPYLLERASVRAVGLTVKHLRVGDVESLNIPVPPLAEQHRIVKKADELITLCDQLKACINDAQTTQLHLADAIVKQAVN